LFPFEWKNPTPFFLVRQLDNCGYYGSLDIHSTKISEFRQAWINALRDDLVAYFKELETLNFLVGEILRPCNADKTTELEQKKQDARNTLLFGYRMIVLRLNMNEKLHVDLDEKLKSFWSLQTQVVDHTKIDEALSLSRQVLKKEWEVTKQFPPFRRFSRYFECRKDSNVA
jgi:hypothetical protein